MRSAPEAVAFVDYAPEPEDFRAAVVKGLSRARKSLPCKFFYDARGAQLFEDICKLPEYYPTRTELSIIKTYGSEIAALAGTAATVIEFGSGSGLKTRALLNALAAPAGYVAIDISRNALLAATQALARERSGLEVIAVCADYSTTLSLPIAAHSRSGRRLGVFFGSTIGNFEPADAVAFLRHARALLGPGSALLVGADLRKDRAILEAAYDDSQGVTAAFNLNLLRRINRELAGSFDLEAFRHRAFYAEGAGRIEMHLESLNAQVATVAGQRFTFDAGETIHTENSHKYALGGFADLARAAGFATRAVWLDRARLFSLHFLEVA